VNIFFSGNDKEVTVRLKSKIISSLVVFVWVFFALTPAQAQSGNLRETLEQYISDLQKNPGDNSLREKIIKLAQEMKPAPKIPGEIDELVGAATYAVKNAKTETDFNDAVDAYQKILLIAPWVPEYYYNLGAVQEKAGKLKEAVASLELYLSAAPDAKDAKEVREHIGGLKYAAQKAAKESSPQVMAEKKEADYAEWLKNLDGARYTGPFIAVDQQYEDELTIHGSTMNWRQRVTYYGQNAVQEVPVGQWYDMSEWGGGQMPIVDREATRSLDGIGVVDTFTISKDGKSIVHVVGGKTFTDYRQ
jgi:tetratricopeptide (TPR) repeat protein